MLRREDVIKKCGHFKGPVLQKMIADTKNIAEWYFYLSGYTSATTLDVISLPVENFERLSLIQFEHWGF